MNTGAGVQGDLCRGCLRVSVNLQSLASHRIVRILNVMVPKPQSLLLWICQQVIVDRASGNPSLINLFTGLPVQEFPSLPQRMSVFAALTDSVGRGRITLEVTCLESDEVIHRVEELINFPTVWLSLTPIFVYPGSPFQQRECMLLPFTFMGTLSLNQPCEYTETEHEFINRIGRQPRTAAVRPDNRCH